ncbi:sugar ABC transporter substrate-binding protein [Patulibacter minatonensis]|uniref:sugar ABC transporter substrate-binding protein n=1 Tax=Patulibacter minatonensis TaxID=298163 RepID=UPI000478C3FE|nr:substrate-binding domain-containing protein [Patulibacter minatonensis]
MLVAAGGLTACGSSDDDTTSTGASGGSGSAASTNADFTGSTPLKSGTIGIVEVNAQSERISEWASTAKKAAEDLGWKAEVIDGKGTPAGWAQAISSLTTKKVDGIITLAIDPPAVATQLQAAKAAKIPVIASGISVAGSGSDLFAARYAPDDSQFGQVLADYLKSKVPAGSEYVNLDLSAVSGAHALITKANPAMQAAGLKLAGTQDINPADIINGTGKATVNLVRSNPKAKIILSCCDFSPPITVASLKQAGKSDVIQAARYDNPSTLALIEKGEPVVTAASNSDQGVLTAVDQIARLKSTGKAIDPKADAGKYEFKVIDKSNVPAGGKYVYDPDSQIAEYVKRWKAEYSR